MNLEKTKQAENEIQALLESIPRAKHFPIPRHETVDAMISSLEGTIQRLKAFVRFLSLLNPIQYLKWMTEAYARYVPGKTSENQDLGKMQQGTPLPSGNNISSKRSGSKTIQNKKPTKSRTIIPA